MPDQKSSAREQREKTAVSVFLLIPTITLGVFAAASWIERRKIHDWSDFGDRIIGSYESLFPAAIEKLLALFWANWPEWLPDVLVFVTVSTVLGNIFTYISYRSSTLGFWWDGVSHWAIAAWRSLLELKLLNALFEISIFIIGFAFLPIALFLLPISFVFLALPIVLFMFILEKLLFFWKKDSGNEMFQALKSIAKTSFWFLLGYVAIVFPLIMIIILDMSLGKNT